MKRMLDLLYAGDTYQAFDVLPNSVYSKYFVGFGLGIGMRRSDLTTMLLLIAVAEGETL